MIDNQKHLFDLPGDVTYIDCAAYSPLMKAVVEAGEIGLRRKVRPWSFTMAEIDHEAERARQLFAGLIGAETRDIAVVPSASYGIATAAANLPLAAGQAVVVLEGQFRSNFYSWRAQTADGGGALVTVARPADNDWTPVVLDAIGPDTAIAALPNSHWTDGSLLDIEIISE